MRKLPLILLSIICCLQCASAQSDGELEAEKAAITATALNYVEGWYEGNAERMEKALHPDLVKRRVHTLKHSGRDIIDDVSAACMVEFTRAGMGKLKEGEEMANEVIILDLYGNIATVKFISKDYIDYLHLGKCNGEWRIINVLWAMKE